MNDSPKLCVVSSSADGWIDQSITDGITAHLPNKTANLHEADVVVVPVSYRNDYRFNRALEGISKRCILIDFIEFGWEAGTKPNLLGTGVIRNFGHLDSDEWGMLDRWAKGTNVVLHFKRELMRRDASKTVLSAEYLCRMPIPPRQSREEFNRRPIEVFSSWGLSNPVRQVLHGEIFKQAHHTGIHVVDAWDQDQHFDGKTWDSKWPVDGKVWATIHCPHYNRKPMAEVMRWQHRAKLSVSLPGSGVKCFRSAEAPVGSIMALQEDDLAWAFNWVDGVNCIRLPKGKEFEGLLAAVKRDDLYEIYSASQETIAKYRPSYYVENHVLPAIFERLGSAPPKKRAVATRPKATGGKQFLHRGDLGDIIACLPAIRASGGGELLIAPHTGAPMQGRQDLRGARYEAIRPLLEIQPYISAVRWVEEPPEGCIDFSTFRQNTIHGQSISMHQARHISVEISEDPWLTATPNEKYRGATIIARSPRYHQRGFPWPQIMRENPEAFFVGLESEHLAFQHRYGSIEYLPTADLLDMAEVMAASKLVVSNQTAAFWVAIGLGCNLLQETWSVSPNSIIRRPNARYFTAAPDRRPVAV